MMQQKLFADSKRNPFEVTPEIVAQFEAIKERARLRLAALDREGPRTVVLVSCVSRKAATPQPARDLYTSQWFVKARAVAESVGDAWFILSAVFGLVRPDEVLPPYNRSMKDLRMRERVGWASRVAGSVRASVPKGSRIIILAGEFYRQHLENLLLVKGYEIEVPMRGLGIGQQLQYLANWEKGTKR